MSIKAEWKNCNLILLCRWFSFGEKYLILGNLDTTVVKICISRPLGTTPENVNLINKAKNHCRPCPNNNEIK